MVIIERCDVDSCPYYEYDGNGGMCCNDVPSRIITEPLADEFPSWCPLWDWDEE